MTNSQRLATVRAAFENWVESQVDPTGETEADPCLTGESILIRDEFYCGRRFRTSTHHAVWFIEEDQLKIFTTSKVLCVVLAAAEIDEWGAPALDASHDDTPQVISMQRPIEASPVADDADEGGNPVRRAA